MQRNNTNNLNVLVNVSRMQELVSQIEYNKAAIQALIQQGVIESQALEVALDTLTDAVLKFEQKKYKDFVTDKSERANAVLTQYDLYASLYDELGLEYFASAKLLLKRIDEYSDAVLEFYHSIHPELENSHEASTEYDTDSEFDSLYGSEPTDDSTTELVSDFEEPDYTGWQIWGPVNLSLLNLELMAANLNANHLNLDPDSVEFADLGSSGVSTQLLPEDLFQSADDRFISEQGINSEDFAAWLEELDLNTPSSTEALILDSEGRIMNNVVSVDNEARFIDDDSEAEEVLDPIRTSQAGFFSRTPTLQRAKSEEEFSPAMPRHA